MKGLMMSSQINNTAVSEASEALTVTEFNSLVNIMAFFDWDTFKRFETLEYSSDDKDLDLDSVKDYVIRTFKRLVADAQQDGDEYRWIEGCYHLRFEYRKNVGLHLIYVPIQEGDDKKAAEDFIL